MLIAAVWRIAVDTTFDMSFRLEEDVRAMANEPRYMRRNRIA